MILLDSSCWIDFFRNADTLANRTVADLVRRQIGDVVTCEPVAMELLAGPTDALAFARVERLVDSLPQLSLDPGVDFRSAAAIQRAVRSQGRTIRSMVDCLIAAVALRHDVEVMHKDADFDLIASVTKLRVRSLL